MRLIVGVVALCMASWAASLSSQSPAVTGESGQDQKGGNGKDAQSKSSQPGQEVTPRVEPKPGPDKTGTRQQSGEDRTDWNKLATITNAAAAILIMIFTGLLVWVGHRQAGATRASAEAAAKSAAAASQSVEAMQESTAVASAALDHAKAQLEETRRGNSLALRAWLVVQSVKLVPQNLSDTIRVAVTVRNVGKLPAVSVTVAMELRENYAVPNGIAVFPDLYGPDGVAIPADGKRRLPFFVKASSPARLDRLLRAPDEPTVYVRVKITYADAGRNEGESTSAYVYLSGTPTREARFVLRESSMS